MNGAAALGGYCLFSAPLGPVPFLAAFCGVTLLAMGGSALNQLLERDIDALMTRTMLRPLPQGRITAATALLAASCAILAGLTMLSVPGFLLPPLFRAAALAWYLGVYTQLKRRTTFALPLGALCGAFPPLIGWCLAGGIPADFRIIILAGLLFIWQIPHFWLLQQRHADDYRRAGIQLVDIRGIGAGRVSLLLLWQAALLTATLLLPALGMVEPRMVSWLLPVLLVPFVIVTLRSTRLLFPAFTLFPLALTAVLILQKMIRIPH
jgi:protoheme IX farnesyltransferase